MLSDPCACCLSLLLALLEISGYQLLQNFFPFLHQEYSYHFKTHLPFFLKKSEDREGNNILLYVHDTEDTKTPAWDEFTNQMQTWSAL